VSAHRTTTEEMLRCWVDDTTLPQPLRNLLAHAADEQRRLVTLLQQCRPFVAGDMSEFANWQEVSQRETELLPLLDAVLAQEVAS